MVARVLDCRSVCSQPHFKLKLEFDGLRAIDGTDFPFRRWQLPSSPALCLVLLVRTLCPKVFIVRTSPESPIRTSTMSLIFETRPLAFWVPVALLSIYAIRTINRRATHKLPPGPKGLPFFGNLFQLSMRPWKEFEVWKKTGQYGKSTPYPPLLHFPQR